MGDVCTYLAALGAVLFTMAGTGLLAFALVVRPMRRRHELELADDRQTIVALAAAKLELRARLDGRESLIPTLRP